MKGLCTDTKFRIEMGGRCSKFEMQETGIRQGRPLSPGLFIITMTVLLHEVKYEPWGDMINDRIPGAEFDETV
jgi:hypothetical protein